MVAANSVNESTTGVVGFTGTAWTATAATNHAVMVGGSTSSTLTNVGPGATSGVPLIAQGASADPTFGTAVVAGGGTGQTTLTNHGVLVGAATSAITQLAVGTTGQVLVGSTGADPAFGAVPFPTVVSSIVEQASAVSLTSGVGANVTSISLTAGSWIISAQVQINASTISSVSMGISTTSATVIFPNDGASTVVGQGAAGAPYNICIPRLVVSPGSTTTYYLAVSATTTGGTTAWGNIVATSH